MKRIGLLGGMSWESSREYYRLLNEGVRERLGGLHSADLILSSVDFAAFSAAMDRGDWDFISGELCRRAAETTRAGAELILIGTNTMHKLADKVAEAAAPAELIHIGQCAADAARRRGLKRVALMGTRFTMEEAFYSSRLEAAGIEVLLPSGEERKWIDRLIFTELCVGVFRDDARRRIREITGRLAAGGAEAVVLGCTELPLILSSDESPLPVLDTMELHCSAALDAALKPD